jgi:hypothetical protein
MRKIIRRVAAVVVLALIAFVPLGPATGAIRSLPQVCMDLAFSTEEDFVTRGPVPGDGNPIISDGDLLGPDCVICARNRELLAGFQIQPDLGLDAADLIDMEQYLVGFSTELDSPSVGQFTKGDLLATSGVIIPNLALTHLFQVGYDIGLDALQFVGDPRSIVAFLDAAKEMPREYWLANPGDLPEMLAEYGIDIWFSTEGTWTPVGRPGFLDGDLLSSRDGIIVASNSMLLPSSVPAGIPERGIDFGLDGVTSDRIGNKEEIRFSTEILFTGRPSFTDGDVLLFGDNVVTSNYDLVGACEPEANFLGLDALSLAITRHVISLPMILKRWGGGPVL